MIWIFEVPIFALMIIAMLVGSIKIGGILRVFGIIQIVIGVVVFIFIPKSTPRTCALMIGFQGIVALLIGIWFADHSIFEFLFGTGWF